MATWIALFATSDDDSADLKQIELEANDKRVAKKLATQECPNGYFLSDLAKTGGRRERFTRVLEDMAIVGTKHAPKTGKCRFIDDSDGYTTHFRIPQPSPTEILGNWGDL